MLRSVLFAAILGACSLAHAQSNELLDFSLVLPPAADRHALVRPTVHWEVRKDAAAHCAGIQGHDGFAVWRQGCVYWHKAQPACTIVTTGRTTHSLMGRLFLLCLNAGEAS